MNVLIVAVILACFAFWEIGLLAFFIFASRTKALEKALVYEDKAIGVIFSMFHRFRGFEIKFENRLNEALPPRFLIISNHQSLLDIPIIMEILPKGVRARFVAKKELAWGIPLISMLLRTSGHCLVKRKGDALQAMRTITTMARRCKVDGTVPVVFPEGTRSRTGFLGVFHSAGFRKIQEIDALPTLVVAVDGGWKVAKLRDFFRNFGKTEYSARFLALLPAPTNKKEALSILDKSREMIEKSLEETREKTR